MASPASYLKVRVPQPPRAKNGMRSSQIGGRKTCCPAQSRTPAESGDAASSGYCLSSSQLSWWGTRSGPLCGWASYLGADGDDRPKCASCAVRKAGRRSLAGEFLDGECDIRSCNGGWLTPSFRNVLHSAMSAGCSRVVGLPMVAASTISLGKAAAPKKDRAIIPAAETCRRLVRF